MTKVLEIQFDKGSLHVEEYFCFEEGQYLVSLRPFFEAADWEVRQGKAYGCMLAIKNGDWLLFNLGDPVINYNGSTYSLPIEPKIIGSRFYIPALPILNIMGYTTKIKSDNDKTVIYTQSKK